VLDSALDAALDAEARPARRAGVVRTTAVGKRPRCCWCGSASTSRFPTADGVRPLVAEDARLLAFEGTPANATWLDDATPPPHSLT
jgi:hypothetical protein